MRAAGFVPIPRNRAVIRETRRSFEQALTRFLTQQRDTITRHLLADAPDHAIGPHVLQAVERLDLRHWQDLAVELTPFYTRVVQDGAAQGVRQIQRYLTRKAELTADDLTNLTNPRAEAWAEARAAELVGMTRLPNGVFIENPDARWAISESTRSMIRDMVEQAIEDGESNAGLADRLAESFAFSESRAENIARTETAFADTHGNLIGYTAMGVEKKESLLSDTHDENLTCDCEENADAGPIPIDEDFPSGDDAPPYHGSCECDLLPVIEDEPDEPTEES